MMAWRFSLQLISKFWNRVQAGPQRKRSGKPEKRRIQFEALEGRQLLAATDFGSIQGRIFDDFNGNGYTSGEEVSQAIVQLYRDNGDGSFQSGSDVLVTSKTTDSTGGFRFDNLASGGYFVRQPSQSISGHNLLEYVGSRIDISATDAAGIANGVIDSFSGTGHSVTASSPGGNPSSGSTLATTEAIGGERDLFAGLTSERGELRLNVNTFVPNRLEFIAGSTTVGRRLITWDGVDGDASNLNATGLNGLDLTRNGSNAAIQVSIGADHPDGKATLRVYSDSGNWSEAIVAIPATGGTVSQPVVIPFSAFTTGGGNGATFTRIGAIQMEVDGTSAVDGQVDSVALIGPKVFTQNFANFEQVDLSLTKTVNNTSPRIGESITFTVGVANAGPETATNVAITDKLPDGMEFVSATATQGSYQSSSGLWNVGTLNKGGSASLQIVARASTSGIKTNVAQVSAVDQFDVDSTPNNNVATEDDQAIASLSPQLIDLSLTKTVDNTAPQIGSNVTFVVSLANAGPSNATGVTVTDVLPAGLTYVSATASQGSYNNTTGLWSVGAVNAGAGSTLNIVARVDNAGVKINAAQITGADQPDVDSTPNNSVPTEDDQAAVSLETPVADLSLTKSVDNTRPNVNQNVTFTITVTNAGPQSATNVAVTDLLPPGLDYVSATANQGSYAQATGIWSVGTVANGASASLQLTGKVTTKGTKTNVAQITGTDQFDPDSAPSNNAAAEDDQASVAVTPQIADLSLAKTTNNASPNPGENVTFTVTVSNAGPDPATNVAVTDQLPTGLELLTATANQGSYSPSTGVWTVGTVGTGTSAALQITAKYNDRTAKTNTAQISAVDQCDPDSTPANGIATEDDMASVTIAPQVVDLALTKSVNTTTPTVGDNVTFSVTVSNTGPNGATNVAVNDKLPAGATFVSATATQGSYDAATGIWNVGAVPTGGQASIQLVAKIESVSPITNVAQVQAAGQLDIDSTPANSIGSEDDQASVRLQPSIPAAPQVVPQAVTLSKRQFLSR